MDRSCPLQNAQPWGAKLKATKAISPINGSCMVLLRGSSWKYSIKNGLVVETVAVRSWADGDQEKAQSTEPVVLEGVDALVQEPVLRAAEDQGERLPPRQVSACGQGRRLDQLHGDRVRVLGRHTKLGTNPRGEIRETCGDQVHWRPPLATRRTIPGAVSSLLIRLSSARRLLPLKAVEPTKADLGQKRCHGTEKVSGTDYVPAW